MSDFNGGYTLNSRGMKSVDAAAKCWGAAARKAAAAGDPIPNRHPYAPGFLESDEDYETFADACDSEYCHYREEERAELARLDTLDPRAWASHAIKWADIDGVFIPCWLSWLAIGHENMNCGRGMDGGKNALLRASADEFAEYNPGVADPLAFVTAVAEAIDA